MSYIQLPRLILPWNFNHCLYRARGKDKNKLHKELRLTIRKQEIIWRFSCYCGCDPLHKMAQHGGWRAENTGLKMSGPSGMILSSTATAIISFPPETLNLSNLSETRAPESSLTSFARYLRHTSKVRNKYDMTYPDLLSSNSCLDSLHSPKERKSKKRLFLVYLPVI